MSAGSACSLWGSPSGDTAAATMRAGTATSSPSWRHAATRRPGWVGSALSDGSTSLFGRGPAAHPVVGSGVGPDTNLTGTATGVAIAGAGAAVCAAAHANAATITALARQPARKLTKDVIIAGTPQRSCE